MAKKKDLVLSREEKELVLEHRKQDTHFKKMDQLRREAFKLIKKLEETEANFYEVSDGEYFDVDIPSVERWEDL